MVSGFFHRSVALFETGQDRRESGRHIGRSPASGMPVLVASTVARTACWCMLGGTYRHQNRANICLHEVLAGLYQGTCPADHLCYFYFQQVKLLHYPVDTTDLGCSIEVHGPLDYALPVLQTCYEDWSQAGLFPFCPLCHCFLLI